MKTLTFKTSSGVSIVLERSMRGDIVMRLPSTSVRLTANDAETLKNLLETMDSSR